MEVTSSPNPNIPVVAPSGPPRPKRNVKWLTLAVLLLLVGAGSLFAVVRDNSNHVAAAPAAVVELTSAGIQPQTVKVRKGDSVTWINNDTDPHHLIASPFGSVGSLLALDSTEPLATGESYTATFDEAGTFLYQDKLNPAAMNATVIVE